jgi:hypothetical protein
MTGELEVKLAVCPIGVTMEHLEQMRGDLAELRRVCRERLAVSDYLTAQPAIEKFGLLIAIAESRLEREAPSPDDR